MSVWLEKLKTKANQLKGETYALYLAYRHPATPRYAKIFAGLVVGYAFSPLDLIPDFIPVLGYLDDLILVPLGITLALKMIPEEALNAAKQQALQELEGEKPKRWIAGAIIILIWIVLAIIMVFWSIGWIREFKGS